ncbi:TRAP transporter large permease [Pollutimonas bauzanensis]|uniref:TRAP transporter large permease protein n=1 Tax=Pollutimonas bauzanensis TaxID=658167 RepID=A0A1M5ZUG8_9BURK|nr:TRAP transporter large permease [Pollutimonas bauzanensis]SHI27573.1 TRAP transporter, DctM subunit [Pollutimonas bauzanensis]
MIVSSLLLLLVLGVPIAAAFALVIIANADAWNIDPFSLAAMPFDTVSNFSLLAIPLFLLVGELMNRGGLVRQLTSVCDLFMSRIRAPMGHIMVLASGLMGAITGSSVATVAAIGGTVGVEMRQRGYSKGYTAALNAASGLLGVLIPPSIPLILYGAIVGVSITNLFIASIVPGILTIIVFMLIHSVLSKRVLPGGQEVMAESAPSPKSAGPVRKLPVLMRALPALMLPVLVLGGIYSGVFTATEAAAIAGIYALAVTILSRQASTGDLKKILEHAALASAAILAIIAFTSIFNRAMILEQVPQSITEIATSFTGSPILFLLAVNVALLLVGMFMETNAATLLMGPLLAPAAINYGIDPVHFGVMLVTNIEIGLLTPPLAANLYVAQRTNEARLTEMFGYVMWFLGGSLIVLGLITFVPALTTWYQLL